MNRIFAALPILCFAVLILVYSVYSASTPAYKFSLPAIANSKPTPLPSQLPPPPSILPDHPLWLAKVMTDKARVLANLNASKRVETLISLSNERLSTAQALFAAGNGADGMTTLLKAEKYLEQAADLEQLYRESGKPTRRMLEGVIAASTMHQQVIDALLEYCPQDARPLIVQTGDTPKRILQETKRAISTLENAPISISL